MIDKDSIERLKQIVDVYEVISSYIELRKAGVNYVACCPFHSEKTPSFVVNPQKGYYKCFGCGVGGDSITFVMEKEHIEFYEAIEKLAYMYNFKLSYTNNEKRFDISDLLEKITHYYQRNLNNEILEYLSQRGVEMASIEKFALGWSGASRDFVNFLTKEKMPLDKLVEVGLIGKSDKGYYAKFNSRIMFPIYSPNSKVVGFGGRILSGDYSKYMNSSQSKIFNKSQLLYGYNIAKESIFKEKKIIITEGYIDVIMLSQAGFCNAVATLGTALTREHLPLLSKGDVEILLCYDGDSAGINAAFKASLLLANKSGGVVIFGDSKDPADIIKDGDVSYLMKLLSAPVPFVEFIANFIANKYQLHIPLEKEKALKEILPFFQSLTPILQDEYRDFIASSIQVSPYLLKQDKRASEVDFSQDSKHIVEDVILKSILEDSALLDVGLEYLKPDAFIVRREAFIALLEGNLNHKDLIGINVNDKIFPLKIAAFKEQLRFFIIKFYEQKKNLIRQDKSLSYDEKISSTREIQAKINLLQKGHLLRVE